MTDKDKTGTGGASKTRIDPFTQTNLVPTKLLMMAAEVRHLRQNKEYWTTVPVPKRPIGRVRFEKLRQAATFVIPVLCFAGAALAVGWKAALFGLPLYYGAGYLHDRWLTAAIAAQRVKDEDLDRGRYAFTRVLGDELGLAPAEVTLAVVDKMADDFISYTKWMREVWPTHPNNPKNPKSPLYKRASQAAGGGSGGRGNAGGSGATGSGGAGGNRGTGSSGGNGNNAGTKYEPVKYPETQWEEPNPWAGVNPTSGLPMIENTPIDVGGNAWGAGGFGGGGFGSGGGFGGGGFEGF